MQGPGWRCGVILVLEVLSVVLAAQDAVQDISDEGLDSFGAGEVVVEGAIRLGRSRSPRALRGTVNGGTPGHDFPTLNAVPATNFNCHGKKHGYYADVDTGCQVFHVCQADGRLNSFLCPNSTIFHQRRLVCDWWYNVKCDASAQYFDVNLEIGKVPAASTRSSGLTGGERAQGSGFSGGAGSQVSGFSGGAGSQGSGFSGSTGSQRSGFSRGAGSQGSRFSSGSGSQRPSFFGGAETQGSGFSGGSGSQASTFTEGAGTQGSGFTGSSGSQVSSFTGGAGTQGSGFSGGSESQASSFTGGAGTQGSGFSGNSGSQVSSFTLGAGTQGSSFSRGSGSQASSFTGGAGTQASGSGRVTGQTPFQAAAAAPQTRPLGPPVTLPSAGDHSRVSGQGSFTSSRGLTPSSARPTLIPAAQVTPSGGSGTFASRVQGTLRTSQTPPRTAPRVPVPTFPPITSPAPTFPPHTTPAHTSPAPTIPTPTATRAPTLIGQAPTRSFTPTRTFAPARVAVSKRPVGTSSHFGVSLPSLNRPPADGVNLLISGIQSSQILDNVADVRDAGFGVPLPSTGGNQATQSVSNQNRIQTTHRFQASQGVSLSNTRSQSQPSSFQSDTRDRKIAVGQPELPVRRPFTTGTPSRGSATFSTRTPQTLRVGQPVGVPLPALSSTVSSGTGHRGSSVPSVPQRDGSNSGAGQRIPGVVATTSQQGATQGSFGIPLPILSSTGGSQGSVGVPLTTAGGVSSVGRFGSTVTRTGGSRLPQGTIGPIIIVEDDRDDSDDRFDLDDRFDDDRFDLDDRFDDDRFDLDDRFDDDRFDDDRFDDDRFDLDDRFDDLDDHFDDLDDRFDDDRFGRTNFLRNPNTLSPGVGLPLPPSEIQLPPPTGF